MARRDLARWVGSIGLMSWSVALCAGAGNELSPATQPSPRPVMMPTTSAVLDGATGPTSRPSTGTFAGARPFPPDYEVLLTRSIFAKGKGGGRSATSAPTTSPDKGLVLRGVAVQGSNRTALLEDVAGKKTRQLHVGDDVVGGRVLAITDDGLDRTMSGRVLHVGVGQSIDGSASAGPSTQQALAREGPPPVGAELGAGASGAIPASAKFTEMKQ